jgi:hypothetical protein
MRRNEWEEYEYRKGNEQTRIEAQKGRKKQGEQEGR